MPQIYDPLKALAGARMPRRRRKLPVNSKRATPKKATTTIGEDLLDFLEDDHKRTQTKIETDRSINNPSVVGDNGETNPADTQSRQKVVASTRSREQSKEVSNRHESIPDSTPSRASLRRHVIGIDTRSINTKEGGRECQSFLNECKGFLRALESRGLAPCSLAFTELHQLESKKKTARPKQPIMRVRTEPITPRSPNQNVTLAAIPFDVAPNQTTGKDPVKVPQQLRGNASWKLFADFVDSILQKDALTRPPTSGPLDITVITNDICLLGDTSKMSHKRGMDTFWERVKPHFLNSVVRRVQIVLAMTNSVVVNETVENKEEEGDDEDEPKADQENPSGPPDTDSERIKHLMRRREISVADCASSIQQHFAEKAQNEFTANRSYIQFGAKVIPSININIAAIDSTSLGFMSLLREWSSEVLSSSYRLSFELPETSDCEKCSICLDAGYKIMPFSLSSPFARAAVTDLERLIKSKLEVEKLVPIASIDASLLFGIPIEVRPALESDLDQHNQMGLLVRALFKQMVLKDCALLLTTTSKRPRDAQADDNGLFHSGEETLLLMVEEAPPALQGESVATTGVLHRIAVAHHLISNSSSDDILARPEVTDADQSFVEYIDACTECLEFSPINPLYMAATSFRCLVSTSMKNSDNIAYDATAQTNEDDTAISSGVAKPQGQSNDSDREESFTKADDDDLSLLATTERKNVWTDKSGVGSRDHVSVDASSRGVNEASTAATASARSSAWDDTGGVGSRFHTGLSQDSDSSNDDLLPRTKKQLVKRTESKKVGSIIQDEDSYDPSHYSVTRHEKAINNGGREKTISSLVSAKRDGKDTPEEEEWSDDLADYCSSDIESSQDMECS